MKVATLAKPGGKPFIAIVNAETETYWPVTDPLQTQPCNMQHLIRNWEEKVQSFDISGEGFPLSAVNILPPIIPERNIFCVGKNYHDHAAEFSKSGFDHSAKEGEIAPEFPVVFTKTPETVIGHKQKIPRYKNVTSQLDYEAELGVIIGKGGKNITRQNASEHVWGYTVINDMTARDLQKNHRQWFIGKSLDGFCPMGPWITTADEMDLSRTTLRCWVNGELRQHASVSQLIFDIPTLIETLSAGIELKPGDVIATGTPAGVGIGFTPPKFLQAGDSVCIEISGIGNLENEVDQ